MAAAGSTEIPRMLEELRAEPFPAARVAGPSHWKATEALAVLPGAFNPPTLAHLELARAALGHGFAAAAFCLGTHTLDKEDGEGLARAERAELLVTLTSNEPGLGVILVNRGLYAEQAEALRRAIPRLSDLAFIVGTDKISQIFEQRYYDDLEGGLESLFRQARLLVVARGTLDHEALAAILARSPASRFSRRIAWIDLDARFRHVSATEVRRRLEHGEGIDDLVPAVVAARLRRGAKKVAGR